jgi:cytochrome b
VDATILGTVGPLGALVVVVAWAIIAKRTGTGSKPDQTEALMLMMTGIREDIRELRHEISQHLQDHARN